jgi:hypothetical protein
MSEAPKKIWGECEEGCWPTVLCGEHKDAGEPYVRADIVDGLVEALQSIAREPSEQSLEYGAKSLRDKARAALTAMEED